MHQIFKRYLYPVMDKHVSVGASDTEPRNVAAGYLQKVAEQEGVLGWLDFT